MRFRSTGAVILKITYGYEIEPSGNDPLLEVTEEGINQISTAAQPGTFLVDLLPFCACIFCWQYYDVRLICALRSEIGPRVDARYGLEADSSPLQGDNV